WVFSTWPVCLRRRSCSSCSRVSRSLVWISAGESSRISLAFMSVRRLMLKRAFAADEPAAERELRVGEAKRLLRDGAGHAGQFKQDGAGLDDGDVVFNATLTGTHSNFGRLLGDGLVREDADPELSLALQVAGDRDARRLDLATGHGATRKGLQAEFPEGEGVAALGIS